SYFRSGSFSTDSARTWLPAMSAMPQQRAQLMLRSESPQCDKSGREQMKQYCLEKQNYLDDFVGAREQRRRYLKAQCNGGLHVDDQFELGWLQHLQVCGLGSL